MVALPIWRVDPVKRTCLTLSATPAGDARLLFMLFLHY
jgi:hypothetical protein